MAKSPSKPFKLAIIGTGGISHAHATGYSKLGDQVQIVAGCDIKQSALDSFCAKWGKDIRQYKDYNEMLREEKDVDAVSVCTPNGVHRDPTIAALNAGKHVIVEKPMAMNPGECEKMIAAARKAKKKLVIGFQYRYHPNTRFIKRAVDDGRFGDIMFVKCLALRRRGIPNWGVFGQKKLQGGGPMIDIGVHCLEMAHYAIGSPEPEAAVGSCFTYLGNKPSNVFCSWPNWDHKTYTVEDLAVGHIRMKNGVVIHIEAAFACHIEKDVWNFQIMGEKGGCRWDPPAIFTDRAGHMTNYSPTHTGSGGFDALFASKLRNWVDACLYNKPLEAPGEAGLAVQKILDGVYRSAANGGKEVAID